MDLETKIDQIHKALVGDELGNIGLVKRVADLEEYKKFLASTPQDVTARFAIAEIYADRLNEPEQAIEEYRRLLLENPPETLWVYSANRIADIYLTQLGNNKKAIEQIKEIMEKFPGSDSASKAMHRIDNIKTFGGDVQ